MIRDERYFIDEIKKDNKYDIFIAIAECSAEYLSERSRVVVTEVEIEFAYKAIEKRILLSRKLINMNINNLIQLGLLECVTEEKNPYTHNATEEEDIKRNNDYFYIEKGNIKIKLTENMQISGRSIYRKICFDKKEKEETKKSSDKIHGYFEEAFQEFYSPHKEKIENMQIQFTKQMDEAEKTYENIQKNLDDSIIKNIQVLSIFVGIISILFSNIIAIKDLVNNGTRTIIILNLSIAIALFFMIILTKLIIINRDKKSVGICIILFLVILLISAIFIII